MHDAFLILQFYWIHFACYARAITGAIRDLHDEIGYVRTA